MILAGIDEAGLGPVLGPLCVAAAALRVPESWDAAAPWTALATAVARKKGGSGDRLVVADSKVAYRAGGLATLERTVTAFAGAAAGAGAEALPVSREKFLTVLGAGRVNELFERYPWYADAEWSVPEYLEAGEAMAGARRLREAGERAGVVVAALRAWPLLAGELNARFDAGLNKAEALLEQTGAQIRFLAESFPDEDILLTLDKQGGRKAYLPFLMSLFPGSWIDTVGETAAVSEYTLERPGGMLRFCFRKKADAEAFPVALASICAKYLRERFMASLNAFFAARVPGLRPTAGYPADAPRFLEAVAGVITSEEIPRDLLVRQR